MKQTQYDFELGKFPATYEAALKADISKLKTAIAGASESSLIGVGSGGSFTVASLLCNFHEFYTGRVSRPSTPLEIISNPTLAASSPVFLVSAEGKNPDIVEALQRARRHSSRSVHILTNRASSALMQCADTLTDIRSHVFELVEKDGYLATNSVLMDAALIARAYRELDNEETPLPPSVDELRVGSTTIDEWVATTDSFVEEACKRGNIIIVYSPILRAVAADLESKLSEAALLYCQLADIRSFAHGRHLWLASRPKDCTLLAIVEPSLRSLWSSMKKLLPEGVPVLDVDLTSALPEDLIAGLIAQMKLVSKIANTLGQDPGRPSVPQFGSELYYSDLDKTVPRPTDLSDGGIQNKYDALGARWPTRVGVGTMKRALHIHKTALSKQHFRSIVFDYDGTLCSSQRDDKPPPDSIIDGLIHLIENGVIIGIASGRGGSIKEFLQGRMPKKCWPLIRLGLYNGGLVTDLGTSTPAATETSEFLSHVTRIMRQLQSLGVPIEVIRTTHPYQVSVRFREGVKTDDMWFVVADALRQAGLDLSGLMRSKHSIDILNVGVSKSRLIAHIITEFKIEPYQVLSVGDLGAWPGNDYALLEHRFSLSVDLPSRRLDRGWKIAPAHKRDVDATLWYLEKIRMTSAGAFTLEF